jgi:hypothetical protein
VPASYVFVLSIFFSCHPSKTPFYPAKYQDASQQNSWQLHAFAAGPPQSGNLVKYPFVFAAPGQTGRRPKPSFARKPYRVAAFAMRHEPRLPAHTSTLRAQKAAK